MAYNLYLPMQRLVVIINPGQLKTNEETNEKFY